MHGLHKPISRARAHAVRGSSPVTMITLMPAVRHWPIAWGTPDRGGSSRPTSPASTRFPAVRSGPCGESQSDGPSRARAAPVRSWRPERRARARVSRCRMARHRFESRRRSRAAAPLRVHPCNRAFVRLVSRTSPTSACARHRTGFRRRACPQHVRQDAPGEVDQGHLHRVADEPAFAGAAGLRHVVTQPGRQHQLAMRVGIDGKQIQLRRARALRPPTPVERSCGSHQRAGLVRADDGGRAPVPTTDERRRIST